MSRLKIAGYLRVSTEEQAALVDGSLDNQKYRLSAFVDLKNVQESNWGKIVEFYIDDGYSAKDTRRPAFQRMLRDIRSGKINLILIADLSRLSRNITDFCALLETLKEHQASFLSIKEQFDTTTPAGKMMIMNMINLAQFEREQTAERVTLNCHARAMRGLLNGGHAVLGYDKIPEKKNTYVVNETEANDVRRIFRAFLECGSLNRTVEKIEALGIKPKVKKNRENRIAERGLWAPQTLAGLLRNPAYIGRKEVNQKYKNADPLFLKPYQRYELVKASWPAIIDKKLFDDVQRLLDENRKMERARLKKSDNRVFLLSGILRCKECGRPLLGSSAHGKNQVHRYYTHAQSRGDTITCKFKRIRADRVEEVMVQHLTKTLQAGDYLRDVAKRIHGIASGTALEGASTKKALDRKLDQLEKEIDSVLSFLRDR